MRQIVMILVVMLLQLKSIGQAIVGNSYITIADMVTVYGISENGDIDTAHHFKVNLDVKFTVNGFDKNNNIKITFWKYSSGKDAVDSPGRKALTKAKVRTYKDDLEYISSWADDREFLIFPAVFNNTCKLYYGNKLEFNFGVMTLPIKVRFGNHKNNYFDFEEKLNLGFVFGLRQQLKGKKEHSLNYLGGIGITSVRTDSLSLKSGGNIANANSTALSLSGGVLYQYENFQIGIFSGQDFIPGALGRDWKHQGKPWIGIAIGVSLFSRNSSQGGDGEN